MSQQLIKSSSLKDLVQNEAVKNRLKEVMGDRAPQFAAALVQIVNQSYQLQKCEPSSVIGAAFTAAALDLSIDPNIGEAHLIPYGDKCQFQIGFKGFIQLAMRSGEYKAFGSTIVHEGELENYDELTGELTMTGRKNPEGKVVGYAAKFKLLNGFERGEFWTVDEIEKHALAYSKQYKFAKGKPDKEANCLWITKRDEMAIKTVEKSLLNHYGPKSIQMKKAIKMDGGAVIDADTGDVSYVDNEKDAPQVSSPEFASAAPVEVEVVSEKKPEKETINKLKAVQGLIKLAGLTEEEVMAFVRDLGSSDAKTLKELEPDVLSMLYEQHGDIFNRIKGAKQ
jgi:recombination protein RecT